MKTCTKCKRILDSEEFGKYFQKKNGKYYYNSRCKECSTNATVVYYHDNIESVKIKQKDYYSRTKDICSDAIVIEEYNSKYLLENKTRVCNTCASEKDINDFERNFNKDKISHRMKCKDCDKPRVNRKNNNIKKKKLATDPNYKLYHLISNKIRAALNGNKAGKSFKKYLDYTMEELKQHLEVQFEPWMTWDNWGVYDCNSWKDDDMSTWRWQIDHTMPHSVFRYASMRDNEFKECWALSNLRPYSAKQNVIDKDRR